MQCVLSKREERDKAADKARKNEKRAEEIVEYLFSWCIIRRRARPLEHLCPLLFEITSVSIARI